VILQKIQDLYEVDIGDFKRKIIACIIGLSMIYSLNMLPGPPLHSSGI